MKFLAIPALLLFAATTSAEEITKHDLCSKHAELAETIMQSYQNGTPMRVMMDYVEQGQLGERAAIMIEMAYNQTPARSERYKQLQQAEFGNVFYQHCMDSEEGSTQ